MSSLNDSIERACEAVRETLSQKKETGFAAVDGEFINLSCLEGEISLSVRHIVMVMAHGPDCLHYKTSITTTAGVVFRCLLPKYEVMELIKLAEEQ